MGARGDHFTGQCILRLVSITACVEIPSSWGPDDVPCVDRHFAALSIQAWALSCCPHGAAVAQGALRCVLLGLTAFLRASLQLEMTSVMSCKKKLVPFCIFCILRRNMASRHSVTRVHSIGIEECL